MTQKKDGTKKKDGTTKKKDGTTSWLEAWEFFYYLFLGGRK